MMQQTKLIGVQSTSIQSYKELDAETLSERYREYISSLWKLGKPSTDLEVTWAAGYTDPNRIRPRRFELQHNFGLLLECNIRECNVSGKQAKTFWFTSSGLQMIKEG